MGLTMYVESAFINPKTRSSICWWPVMWLLFYNIVFFSKKKDIIHHPYFLNLAIFFFADGIGVVLILIAFFPKLNLNTDIVAKCYLQNNS